MGTRVNCSLKAKGHLLAQSRSLRVPSGNPLSPNLGAEFSLDLPLTLSVLGIYLATIPSVYLSQLSYC